MKKLIISAILACGLAGSALAGNSVTVTVVPGTMTNVLANFPGSVYVQQVILTAPVTTNAAVQLVDTPTNQLSYIIPQYTNTTRYATNWISTWTNFYGTVQSWTNISLIDVTNNVVTGSTNLYPVRLNAATLANTSTTFGNTASLGYYFDNGVWVTNLLGSGNATVTIQYR